MKQSAPVLTLSRVASGTIAAHRFVTVAGAQSGADAVALGVARTAATSGVLIPVDVIGTALVTAGAAITANDTVKSDSTGRAITWATSGGKLGIALEAAGAAGEIIEVLLTPAAP